jgi:hypothetical protein
MSESGISFGEVLLAFIPILTAVLAGLLGWVIGRGRERRDMRRQAYVDWLRAARNLVTPPPGVVPQRPGTVTVPFPKRIQELNDSTVEIKVVGSKRVGDEADKFLQWVDGPNLAGELEGDHSTFNQVVDRFQQLSRPYTDAVLAEMRKDLRTKR